MNSGRESNRSVPGLVRRAKSRAESETLKIPPNLPLLKGGDGATTLMSGVAFSNGNCPRANELWVTSKPAVFSYEEREKPRRLQEATRGAD